MAKSKGAYRFSFGPWNIEEGADPFGPAVRNPVEMGKKLKLYKKLGFHGIQLHDDDAVPDFDSKSDAQVAKECKALKKVLDGEGIQAEFVAPRLWFAAETIDGAYTNNSAKLRKYAIERTKRCIDVNNHLGTSHMVVWFAREGSYIRESKNSREMVLQIRDALNELLEYDKNIKILIEPKPNEPVDSAIIPTIGHAIGMCYMTNHNDRMGTLIETAHSLLAGLDPSDDMGYALAHNKLWSVHLNDQGGLKFDQDKSFGSFNLRHAFNQVRVLEEYGFAEKCGWVGFDVKAMRTQPQAHNTKHLSSSLERFKILVDKVKSLDRKLEAQLIAARDYEELDRYILLHLMGKKY